jgi:hypothetical protein
MLGMRSKHPNGVTNENTTHVDKEQVEFGYAVFRPSFRDNFYLYHWIHDLLVFDQFKDALDGCYTYVCNAKNTVLLVFR